MSYMRVIPRDLFNESSLMKCTGQLYLLLESKNIIGAELTHANDSFRIDQSESDGSIHFTNLFFAFKGKHWYLTRPLNSRNPWPLYLRRNGVEISVFDNDGCLSPEFLDAFTGGN